MRLAELDDDRRLAREPRQASLRQVPLPQAPLRQVPLRQVPLRQPKRAARHASRRGTGFEPFLIAAVLGLFLWALILSPLFL